MVTSPEGEPTDTRLAQAVQRGDVVAYELLVRRHMNRAFSLAQRLLGHRQDAEDMVQETFLAALEKISTFDPTREFSPWFYRILVNRCLNARKTRTRRATVQIPEGVATDFASPLIDTERSELREHIQDAIMRLPERQQEIFVMSDFNGFSSPEIAEAMGISDGTVRWHLHQARRTLREALEPYARRNI